MIREGNLSGLLPSLKNQRLAVYPNLVTHPPSPLHHHDLFLLWKDSYFPSAMPTTLINPNREHGQKLLALPPFQASLMGPPMMLDEY